MGVLEFLWGRALRRPALSQGLLASLLRRVPADDGRGLDPDPRLDAAEVAAGERFLVAFHTEPLEIDALPRRIAAMRSAAERQRPDELAEALGRIAPASSGELLGALDALGAPVKRELSRCARALADEAGELPLLGLALALLGLEEREDHRALLLDAGRSAALSGCASFALARLPFEAATEALLALAARAPDVGRAAVIEQLALLAPEEGALAARAPQVADEAIGLAAAIVDPVLRSYASIALIEVAAPAPRLADSTLAASVASCLEALARGGWRGGPGPGLARLPAALAAAEGLLADTRAPAGDAVVRTARAVLAASPAAPYPLRQAAERVLRDSGSPP